MRSDIDGLEAAIAVLVHRATRRLFRDPGKKRGDTRNIGALLPDLAQAPNDHVFDLHFIELGASRVYSFQQSSECIGHEILSGCLAELTAFLHSLPPRLANSRTHCIHNYHFLQLRHVRTSFASNVFATAFPKETRYEPSSSSLATAPVIPHPSFSLIIHDEVITREQ
jgi:hypothetical protein